MKVLSDMDNKGYSVYLIFEAYNLAERMLAISSRLLVPNSANMLVWKFMSSDPKMIIMIVDKMDSIVLSRC